jgi:hypothetical protein
VERDADGRLLVVVDSSFLINFLVVDRMDILSRLSKFASMWSLRRSRLPPSLACFSSNCCHQGTTDEVVRR